MTVKVGGMILDGDVERFLAKDRKPRTEPSQRGRFCDACQRWFPEGMGSHICIPRARS